MSDPVIKLKKAAVATQGGSCGGILTDDDIKSGVPANWEPDVSEIDRLAGWEWTGKGFVKKETTNPFTSGWLINSRLSEAEDRLRIAAGTPDDVWTAASGYADALWFGSGELAASGAIGSAVFEADFEAADGIHDGDTVFILDRTINRWEQFTLSDPGGVSWATLRATLTIDGATTYAYPVKAKAYLLGTSQEAFSLSGTYLCIRIDGNNTITIYFTTETTASEVADTINTATSGYVTASDVGGYLYLERDLYYYHRYFQCVAGAVAMAELGLGSTVRRGGDGTVIAAGVSLGTIAPSVTTPVVSSAAGTFDNSTYPIAANEAGGVDDDFVLTFLDATHYSIAGTKSGAIVTNHLISDDCAPTHWSGAYFTIDKDAFGGTFGVGETITWSTVSSSKGFWVKATGAAGCPRFDPNRSGLKIIGSV